MKQNNRRATHFSVAVLSALTLVALCGLPATAQQPPTQPEVLHNAAANRPIHFDVSRPLAELAKQASALQSGV